MMFNAIVGTKHCDLEIKTEQGLWDQVILVNAKKIKQGAKPVRFKYHGS